ncbi:hypothetical protein Pmani_004112 [Petrolisthes manimaculis]|uniref:Uncharacterized protein n=1 Tax=Petrolisthes manimaculis TaxID=1843537 RepID=A0AAE1QEB1_9EUCA|nr:hypothetical protein Pmani_004112 [Petrolisthes manimaculis]
MGGDGDGSDVAGESGGEGGSWLAIRVYKGGEERQTVVARPTDQTLTLLLLLLMPGNATVEEVSVSGAARAPLPSSGARSSCWGGESYDGAACRSVAAHCRHRGVVRGEGGCMGTGPRVAPVLPSPTPFLTPHLAQSPTVSL